MNINDLNDILVEYIKNNKIKYDIDYKETIETLKEVLKEIETDFENAD